MHLQLSKKAKSDLNELLSYLYDSNNGYKKCSEKTTNDALRELFKKLAEKRTNMIKELKTNFPDLITAENGTIMGNIHRTFIDFKNILHENNDQNILKEIKRGENVMLDKYRELINNTIPQILISILCQQAGKVIRDIATIDLTTIPSFESNENPSYDPVDEASRESFPASDAPAWINKEKKDEGEKK